MCMHAGVKERRWKSEGYRQRLNGELPRGGCGMVSESGDGAADTRVCVGGPSRYCMRSRVWALALLAAQ